MTFRSTNRVAIRSRARRQPAAGRLLAVLAVLAAAGCASAGGGAGSRDTVWREDLGRMNKATISQGVAKIVQKHGLRINRQEDRPREVYYEMEWIARAVTAEEELRGVTGARNRIVLRGRLLESGFGAGAEAFRVTWEVEGTRSRLRRPRVGTRTRYRRRRSPNSAPSSRNSPWRPARAYGDSWALGQPAGRLPGVRGFCPRALGCAGDPAVETVRKALLRPRGWRAGRDTTGLRSCPRHLCSGRCRR